MIRFRVLGPLELKGSGGEDVLSVLSQPKRIALLAYLALSTADGFQRRDTLVGLFWPELDEGRARGALRKAIYFLRKSLGEEVLYSRTGEELALNWSLLACDAVDFENALREGDVELALDLYRGDLLEGVFIPECSEFENWLDHQRQKLREAAASAAWTLAHRYLRMGRVTDGERMGQRALELIPTDEHEVRRFIEALNAAGDRAGAVYFFEKFARILKDSLELRPAAETRALVQGMRNTLDTPVGPPSGPGSEPLPAGRGAGLSSTPTESLLERVRNALSHRYAVLEEVGSGGMATVFLAEDPKHRRRIALKVLDPSIAESVGTERFLHEIEIAANLNHPHILPLFDSGEAEGLLYYVMPFVEGESLQARLKREKQLPVRDALAITREIALALGFAHEKGIVHRDVKPGNILLEAGHAVLADFGIAQAVALAGGRQWTRPGMAVGTPAYMSPEQGTGDTELDGRSDQYSLACVLYEMLAGQEPFRGPTGESVTRQHLTRDPIGIQQLRPSVPDPVSGALGRAMAKAPADRFSTMRDFAQALDHLPERSSHGPRPGIFKVPVLGSLAVVAVLVSAYLLATISRERDLPPDLPKSDGIVLAILPFSVQGPDSMQWISESMVTLLGTSMDDVGGVRTVDRNRLLESVGHLEPGARVSLLEAKETARRFGATHFILGEGVGAGEGRLTLAMTLYPVDGGPGDEIEVRVDGSSSDPYALVDSLLRPILGGLQVAAGQRLSGLAALTTDSTSALRAFLTGEEDFRSTRYAEAYDAFDRAVEIDRTFALAHYRKSVAAVLDLKFDQAHLAADRAWEYSSRLTRRDRRLLQAWGALIDGSAEQAERLYQAILRDYPDEVEAHFGLGSVFVYFNPIRGRSIHEAEPHFQRVVDLMPSFGQARFHLLEFATIRKDRWAFDSLFEGVDKESDQALAWKAVRAFGWGSRESREQVEAEVRTAPPVEAGLAVARVAAYLQAYAEAESLANLLAGPDRDSDTRSAARVLTAFMRFARGRWTEGMASLHEAGELNPAWAIELQALFTGFPLRSSSPEELDDLRERLLAWEADQVSPSTNFVLFAHNRFHVALRLYLLALTDVWQGDLEEALSYAGELSRQGHSRELRAINLAWAQGIRARVAFVRGDTVEATRLLENARAEVRLELVAISPFFSRSFDRFLLAQFLWAQGMDEEALDWFRTLTEGHELVLVAPAHLYLARILESQGHAAEARNHYARFEEIWMDADPRFQPLVEEARLKQVRLADPTDRDSIPVERSGHSQVTDRARPRWNFPIACCQVPDPGHPAFFGDPSFRKEVYHESARIRASLIGPRLPDPAGAVPTPGWPVSLEPAVLPKNHRPGNRQALLRRGE